MLAFKFFTLVTNVFLYFLSFKRFKFDQVGSEFCLRATGQDSRSLCSAVCKWNYSVKPTGEIVGWDTDYLKAVSLQDLASDNFKRLGINRRTGWENQLENAVNNFAIFKGYICFREHCPLTRRACQWRSFKEEC